MAASGIVSLLVQAKNEASNVLASLTKTLGVDVPAAANKARVAVASVANAGGKDITAPGQLAKDLQTFNQAGEGSTQGARRLERALETLLFAASGLPGEIGHVAGAFAVFAVGGEIAVGIAALSAVIGLFALDGSRDMREIAKAADEAAKKLNEAANARSGATLRDQKSNVDFKRDLLQGEFEEAKKNSEAAVTFFNSGILGGFQNLVKNIKSSLSDGATFGGGGEGILDKVKGVFSETSRAENLKKGLDVFGPAAREATRSVEEFRRANDRSLDSIEKVAAEGPLQASQLKELTRLRASYTEEIAKNAAGVERGTGINKVNAEDATTRAQDNIAKIDALRKSNVEKLNAAEQQRIALLAEQAKDISLTDAQRQLALSQLLEKERALKTLQAQQLAGGIPRGPVALQAATNTRADLGTVQAGIAAATTAPVEEAIKALDKQRTLETLSLADLPKIVALQAAVATQIAKGGISLQLRNALEAQELALIGLAKDARRTDGEVELKTLEEKGRLNRLTAGDLAKAAQDQQRFNVLANDANLSASVRNDYAQKEQRARQVIIGYATQQAALAHAAVDAQVRQLQIEDTARQQAAKDVASQGKDQSDATKKADRAAEIEALQRLAAIQARLNALIEQETIDIAAAGAAQNDEEVKRLTAERQQNEQTLQNVASLKLQTQEQLNAGDVTLQLTKELKGDLGNTLESFFGSGIDGFNRLSDAARAFGREIAGIFQRISAQVLTNAILKGIFGTAPGSAGSSGVSALLPGQVVGAVPAAATAVKDVTKEAATIAEKTALVGSASAITAAATGSSAAAAALSAAAAALSAAAAALSAGGAAGNAGGLSGLLGGLLGGGGGSAATLSGDASSLAEVFAADGGVISGPGTGTSDSVPAMLSTGEGVLTARAVAALGGINGVSYLNGLGVRGYRPMRFATGGVVGQAGGSARVDGAISIGLDDGLIARHLGTPEGQRALIKVVAKNRNTISSVLGR